MSRDAGERFADIIAAIERCRRYGQHLDDQDESIAAMAYDAILRNLAVIGEALRSLTVAYSSVASTSARSRYR